jgi:hypothetical protein
MELKPRAIEHWDSFNEYRDSITLYQIGNVYMIEHENCFSFNGGKQIHYWSTQAEAQVEVDRIKAGWARDYKKGKALA